MDLQNAKQIVTRMMNPGIVSLMLEFLYQEGYEVRTRLIGKDRTHQKLKWETLDEEEVEDKV